MIGVSDVIMKGVGNNELLRNWTLDAIASYSGYDCLAGQPGFTQ